MPCSWSAAKPATTSCRILKHSAVGYFVASSMHLMFNAFAFVSAADDSLSFAAPTGSTTRASDDAQSSSAIYTKFESSSSAKHLKIFGCSSEAMRA